MPNENISVPVDNHIETLKIEITTVSAESEFSLLYPNGMSSLNKIAEFTNECSWIFQKDIDIHLYLQFANN